MISVSWRRGCLCAMLFGAAAGGNFAVAQESKKFHVAEEAEISPKIDRNAKALLADEKPAQIKLPEYWLGIHCVTIEPALRSHLNLEDQEGLLVESVMPESPAHKAGFQVHDILLAADDKTLKEIRHLLELLDDRKENEISFSILRAGEKTKIAVTPAKRPKNAAGEQDRMLWPGNGANPALESLRAELRRSGKPLRMQFLHPGIVLPPGAPAEKFPDDLHVHVHKHGDKPAEIVVERGEKKWSVSEDKLDELPDNIRPHVEALLGRLPMPKFDLELGEGSAPNAGASFQIPMPGNGEFAQQMEKRFEEMNRRMEQMRNQISELREGRRQAREKTSEESSLKEPAEAAKD